MECNRLGYTPFIWIRMFVNRGLLDFLEIDVGDVVAVVAGVGVGGVGCACAGVGTGLGLCVEDVLLASAWLSLSTRSFSLASAAALASASSFMRLISASVRPLDASMRMLCSLPVALSLALTLRMPFASISKVTSI